MKRYRRTLALLSAMAMGFSMVQLPASAAESTDLPDWIPKNFKEALQFNNQYGKHHIDDGLICCVRKEQYNRDDRDYAISTEGSTAEYELLSQEAYYFDLPPKPDPSDNQAYSAYLRELRELGLSENDVDFGVSVEFRYEVFVYKPKSEGTLLLDWAAGLGLTIPDAVMEFEVAKDGTFTQKDTSAWLPDCITEWEVFYDEFAGASIHDNYIVYCDEVAGDGGYQLFVDSTGEGVVEMITDYTILPVRLGTWDGGKYNTIQLYKPVAPGILTMTFTEKRTWESDVVSSDSYHFEIKDDLSVKQLEHLEAVEPPSGDCNSDGVCSVTDAVMLQKWLLGLGNLVVPRNADLTGDGRVNAFDLAVMKQELLSQTIAATPNGMPVIYGDVTADEREILWTILRTQYPDTDFSDFRFVHDPNHPLGNYRSGKLFSIYYKDILLHGYGNLNTDCNAFAAIGKYDAVNFVVDPKLFAQVDTQQEVVPPWEVLPTCIDTEKPQLILYVDDRDEKSPDLLTEQWVSAVRRNGFSMP